MSFFTRNGYFRKDTYKTSWTLTWWTWGSFWYFIFTNEDTRTGSLQVRFTQSDILTGEKKDFDYTIELEATTCHYGWLRWWFRDPCDPECRRCSVLYMQNNGYFASAKTLNLAYDTQNQRKWFWRAEMESIKAMLLYKEIKYRYRNWKPTRKMKRALKYLNNGLYAQGYRTDADISKALHLKNTA